ncbi:hypothetical protein Nmel_001086 [Mimus melanotis]
MGGSLGFGGAELRRKGGPLAESLRQGQEFRIIAKPRQEPFSDVCISGSACGRGQEAGGATPSHSIDQSHLCACLGLWELDPA